MCACGTQASIHFVVQRERKVGAMADRRGTLAAETTEFARPRTGDDRVRFLRLAVLENARALQHEAAAPAADPPGDPLESDEGGCPVAAVHHHVLDVTLA